MTGQARMYTDHCSVSLLCILILYKYNKERTCMDVEFMHDIPIAIFNSLE